MRDPGDRSQIAMAAATFHLAPHRAEAIILWCASALGIIAAAASLSRIFQRRVASA